MWTEAEIEAQMDLIDRVDEMDEAGVLDSLDAFEQYKHFCDWRDKVERDTGQRPATTFSEWLDSGVYEAPGPGRRESI